MLGSQAQMRTQAALLAGLIAAIIAVARLPVQVSAVDVQPSLIEVDEFQQVVLHASGGLQGTTFQWFFNGEAISTQDQPTAVSSDLVIESVDRSHAGSYHVQATYQGQVQSSTLAVVRVFYAPSITHQPPSFVGGNPNSTVEISVMVASEPAATFQWFKDDIELEGKVSNMIVLGNLSEVDEGRYSVQVCNRIDCVESSASVLRLNDPPSIVSNLSPAMVALGEDALLSVLATGRPYPAFEWFKDGVLVPGATGSSLTVIAATSSDAGSYRVRVSNSLGSIWSQRATLEVIPPPVASLDMTPISVYAGAMVTLPLNISTPIEHASITWFLNGDALPGQVEPSLLLTDIQPAHAGRYHAVISTFAGTIETGSKAILVDGNPERLGFTSSDAGNGDILLAVSDIVGTDYSWSIDGVSVAVTPSNSIILSANYTGTHTIAVEVVDAVNFVTTIVARDGVFLFPNQATPPPQSTQTNSNATIYVVIGGIIAVLALFSIVFVLLRRKRTKRGVTKFELPAATFSDSDIHVWVRKLIPGKGVGSQPPTIRKPADISPSNILLTDTVIADGEITHVRLARIQPSNKMVEAKILKASDSDSRAGFLVEAYMLNTLQHKHVLPMHGASVQGMVWTFVTDLPEHGRLKHMLMSPLAGTFAEARLLTFCLDIARGMEHLEALGCTHRALTALHVAVTDDFVCKLSEFGFTRRLYGVRDEFETITGIFLARWQALEVLTTEEFGPRSDVWSFAVVMWEIFNRGADPYITEGWNAENFIDRLSDNYRLEAPESCSFPVCQLMQACWSRAPADRPSFSTIVSRLTALLQKTAVETAPLYDVIDRNYADVGGNDSYIEVDSIVLTHNEENGSAQQQQQEQQQQNNDQKQHVYSHLSTSRSSLAASQDVCSVKQRANYVTGRADPSQQVLYPPMTPERVAEASRSTQLTPVAGFGKFLARLGNPAEKSPAPLFSKLKTAGFKSRPVMGDVPFESVRVYNGPDTQPTYALAAEKRRGTQSSMPDGSTAPTQATATANPPLFESMDSTTSSNVEAMSLNPLQEDADDMDTVPSSTPDHTMLARVQVQHYAQSPKRSLAVIPSRATKPRVLKHTLANMEEGTDATLRAPQHHMPLQPPHGSSFPLRAPKASFRIGNVNIMKAGKDYTENIVVHAPMVNSTQLSGSNVHNINPNETLAAVDATKGQISKIYHENDDTLNSSAPMLNRSEYENQPAIDAAMKAARDATNAYPYAQTQLAPTNAVLPNHSSQADDTDDSHLSQNFKKDDSLLEGAPLTLFENPAVPMVDSDLFRDIVRHGSIVNETDVDDTVCGEVDEIMHSNTTPPLPPPPPPMCFRTANACELDGRTSTRDAATAVHVDAQEHASTFSSEKSGQPLRLSTTTNNSNSSFADGQKKAVKKGPPPPAPRQRRGKQGGRSNSFASIKECDEENATPRAHDENTPVKAVAPPLLAARRVNQLAHAVNFTGDMSPASKEAYSAFSRS